MKIKETGLMFKPHLVRAILAGDKTQTRRPLGNQESYANWVSATQIIKDPIFKRLFPRADSSSWLLQKEYGPLADLRFQQVVCPYGAVGDTIWVRETYQKSGDAYIYRADDETTPVKWRSSMLMPKNHCRIWLEITDINLEQLYTMRPVDVVLEGYSSGLVEDFFGDWVELYGTKKMWVWAITFKRCER